MLVLEVMSLFMLGLLGAALPAAGSGDDDEDKDSSDDDSPEAEARAPAAEGDEDEGEGTPLLDYAAADPATDPAEEEDDPWALEAEDAAYEDSLDEVEDEPDAASADLDVLAAIARLTSATPPAADDADEEAALEAALAPAAPAPSAETDAEEDDTAADETDEDDDEDDAVGAEAAPDDLTATTIVDYQPGSDQIEITIFAPPPDTAVDVVLQQTADGTGTEVLIDGKLRAILDGVLPGDVDANDLYIEFAG